MSDAMSDTIFDAIALLCPVPHLVYPQGPGCRPGRGLLLQRAPSAATPEVDAVLATASSIWQRRGLPSLEDARRDRSSSRGVPVKLALDPAEFSHPEAYRLDVSATVMHLAAPSPAGLFYGLMTLAQWMTLHRKRAEDDRLPGLHIEDRPDLAHRGVLLDVSRDRVPTMETLYALVDRLAEWKFNQLQLYMEHTFAYAGHEVVWRDASPFTGEEIEALDSYCAARFIELVPNQNSFGHFHRWLKHPAYRDLAECPEGVEHPFSSGREPFSLCPTDPRTLQLLADLYAQLLPHFTSRLFNVGLDETFDLGLGRSAEACRRRGKHAVYLEFLRRVHSLVERHDHRMQFWGDIILQPDAGSETVPRSAIPLAWGYEADHPFDRDLQRLEDSGFDFYACPGTSSWRSLGGRTTNALDNLRRASHAAHHHGADGLLVTDWGDAGHLQPLPVSYCGLLAAARWSWNTESDATMEFDVEAALQRHAFPTLDGAGEAFARLGQAGAATGVALRNGTVLFRLLVSPDDDLELPRYRALTVDGLEAARATIQEARTCLQTATASDAEGQLVKREFDWVADLLDLACRLGIGRLEAGRGVPIEALPGPLRRELLDDYLPLVEAHRALWLARSRPGGRKDSVAHLEVLANRLTGEP